MSAFTHGAVTVRTTPTLICTVTQGNNQANVQNVGDNDVLLGGPDVAASGARLGYRLVAGDQLQVASPEFDVNDLYGVVVDGATTVVYLI